MYITSNKRDPRYFDLYKIELSQSGPTLLYQNDSAYDIGAVSYTHLDVYKRQVINTAADGLRSSTSVRTLNKIIDGNFGLY